MQVPPELQARINAIRGNASDGGSDELSRLRAKLAARKGQPGYKDNVAEIEARISQLENEHDGQG